MFQHDRALSAPMRRTQVSRFGEEGLKKSAPPRSWLHPTAFWACFTWTTSFHSSYTTWDWGSDSVNDFRLKKQALIILRLASWFLSVQLWMRMRKHCSDTHSHTLWSSHRDSELLSGGASAAAVSPNISQPHAASPWIHQTLQTLHAGFIHRVRNDLWVQTLLQMSKSWHWGLKTR